jgi:hypothetical protein
VRRGARQKGVEENDDFTRRRYGGGKRSAAFNVIIVALVSFPVRLKALYGELVGDIIHVDIADPGRRKCR